MIQANELRIGNWVHTGEFHIEKFQGYHKIKSKWFDYAHMFEPIPLTEEILLKCGFEKFAQTWYRHKLSGFEFALSGLIATNSYFECFPVDCCNHLHQLQNLYFALTNEELNIEL